MKNKKLAFGFTLIEVAMVTLVIVLFALFVLPAYASYNKRAKIAEGVAFAEQAKLAVTRYVTDGSPISPVQIPPAISDTVQHIDIYLTNDTGIGVTGHIIDLSPRHAGEIVIVYTNKIASTNHNELVLSPRVADPYNLVSDGHDRPINLSQPSPNLTIVWECNSADPPAMNRGTRGNLDSKLAPSECRHS